MLCAVYLLSTDQHPFHFESRCCPLLCSRSVVRSPLYPPASLLLSTNGSTLDLPPTTFVPHHRKCSAKVRGAEQLQQAPPLLCLHAHCIALSCADLLVQGEDSWWQVGVPVHHQVFSAAQVWRLRRM